MNQICPKRVISGPKEKNWNFQKKKKKKFSKFELVQCHISSYTSNFDFEQNFTQKVYFPSKVGQVIVTTEFSILELVQVPTFILSKQFWFFGQNCPRIFDHQHQIKHIRISLSTKFLLKQAFFVQTCPKRIEKTL